MLSASLSGHLGCGFANDLDAFDERQGKNAVGLQIVGSLAGAKCDGFAGGIQRIHRNCT